MKLTYQREHRSITGSVTNDELPDFTVVSGLNGSGKTQLLEAIEKSSLTTNRVNAGIRRFDASEIGFREPHSAAGGNFTESWVGFADTVRQQTNMLRTEALDFADHPNSLEARLKQSLVNQQQLAAASLDRLTSLAGKRLIEFDDNDYRAYVPQLVGVNDVFGLSLTGLFVGYRHLAEENTYRRWRTERGEAVGPSLTDSEFAEHFGGPPWMLLDEILDLLKIEYSFVPPPLGRGNNQDYSAKLQHDSTGATITTGELSSGEKTLLRIAFALYSGSHLGEAIRMPSVLLLDEPDASLHPSMISVLLQVLRDTFVARYNVKVIMTTHSPTTVALAPEESLYIMRRSGDPRLRRANNRDEALNSLTVGLSTLSIRVESRRTVFVESEHDESCYQELFRLIRPRLNTPFSLEFVASGHGGQGNCEAVKYLVKALREHGNTNVWGIIDRDARKDAEPGIAVNFERYAIENVALDPLILGAFLLREQIVTSGDLGLEPDLRHFELRGEHAQRTIDAMSAKLASADDKPTVEVPYLGAFAAQVPQFWLETQGHDLEALVLDAFPPLKAMARNLLVRIITRGLGDLPDFLPTSVATMLAELARDA